MLFRRAMSAQPITAAVILGFALTLGVWLAAGYVFTNRIRDARGRAETVRERYMAAQEQLSQVNSKILLGSVYLRDALMSMDADATARSVFEDTLNTIGTAMNRYVPVLNSAAERERVDRLRLELDEFERRMVAVLDRANAGSAGEARVLLQTQVVPKRDVVIRLSEEVRALNREGFVQHQADIAAIYGDNQRWFWWILTLAMTASFGIALVAVRHAGRLEHRLLQRAVADARTAAELQRLSARLITTQEEERRTLARELHDEVGQAVTAIKVELAVAERAMLGAGLSANLLDNPRTIADGTLATIRDLSHLLRPPMLDDLGLEQALQSYVQTFSRRHDIDVALDAAPLDRRLPADVETTVYRIVQEALTNVARHAEARRVQISIADERDAVSLVVEDDGRGFDPAGLIRDPGLGIVGMRERILQLGGTFTLDSRPGQGTRLTFRIPTMTTTAFAATEAAQPSSRLATAHE